MFKRLLVLLDGSGLGSRTLKYATELARCFNAKIVLLRVIQLAKPIAATGGVALGIASPSTAELAVLATPEEDKRNTTRARRYLSSKARTMKSQNIKTSYKVVLGEPARSIMAFSKQEKIDLVAMTTHGRSGLRRAVMGSVVDAVI